MIYLTKRRKLLILWNPSEFISIWYSYPIESMSVKVINDLNFSAALLEKVVLEVELVWW